MSIQTILTITSNDSAAQMKANRGYNAQAKSETGNSLMDYLSALSSGSKTASIDIQIDGGNSVAASGTLTLTSVVATNTCIINGVTFTAIAAGAVGNQFNVGGTDTITATNLKNAINASATALVSGVVSATSSGAVVTVSAVKKGALGNLNTLTGSANIVASGARLTGGTDASSHSITF